MLWISVLNVENATDTWHDEVKLQWYICGIRVIRFLPSNMTDIQVDQINHNLYQMLMQILCTYKKQLFCSPNVVSKSRSVTFFKFIWFILITLIVWGIFVAQQSIIIIIGYYTAIDPPRRNSFVFIPSAQHSEVRAQWQNRASGTMGDLVSCSMILKQGVFWNRGLNLGLSCSGSVSLMISSHSFNLSTPSTLLPLTCSCITYKRGKTQSVDNIPILKHSTLPAVQLW